MYRLLIAYRYLLTRPILWISVVGVMLGIGAILVVDSIWNGFMRETTRIGKGINADLVITIPEVRTPFAKLREELFEVSGVKGVARRLLRWGLFPTDVRLPSQFGLGELSRGAVIQLTGIVYAEEISVTKLPEFLTAAPPERAVADPLNPFDLSALTGTHAPDSNGRPDIPILLGEKLASALKLKRGDVLQLLTISESTSVDRQGAIQPPAADFHLVGTFVTENFSADLTTAYVPLEDLRRFAELPANAHQVVVRMADGVDEDELCKQIQKKLFPLGVDPQFVETWGESQGPLLGAVENQRHILNVILFFIILVAGFNLLVTLHMTVTEKVRDIGILVSMGASSIGVASIYTACGVLVSLLGTSMGYLLGATVAFHINEIHGALAGILGRPIWTENVYGFREIPVEIDFMRNGMYGLATFVCTYLFAAVAAWRVARMSPIVALRSE